MRDVDFILASGSPARKKVLADAGFNFSVQIAKSVDEEAILETHSHSTIPEKLIALADAKAREISEQILTSSSFRDDRIYLVLGCDSMFEFDGQLLGKPYTADKALKRILDYRGKYGLLHTAHVIHAINGHLLNARDVKTYQYMKASFGAYFSCETIATTTVKFANYSEDDAKAYASTDEPLQVAGGFAIDGRGSALIDSIDGDYYNVVGVSPNTIRELLDGLVPVSQLWHK